MKRFVLYLLLTLCLAGCAPAAPAPSSASISPPAASSSALEEPALSQPQAAHVPPGSYAPWQEGYAGFLTNLRSSEYRHTLGELDFPGDDMPSVSYSLYDVDKDGVPELFLKCGTCEADYYTLGYTFRGGQVVNLGSFQSGHSSLYTVPGENGIIFREGHMGYGSIEKFSLTDGGSIGPWETLLTETEEDTRQDGYTDPGELIPGSQPIPYYYTCTQFRPADSPALVLPIYDYQGRELPVPMEEAEVRAAIGKVLYENAPLFGEQTDCLGRCERGRPDRLPAPDGAGDLDRYLLHRPQRERGYGLRLFLRQRPGRGSGARRRGHPSVLRKYLGAGLLLQKSVLYCPHARAGSE